MLEGVDDRGRASHVRLYQNATSGLAHAGRKITAMKERNVADDTPT